MSQIWVVVKFLLCARCYPTRAYTDKDVDLRAIGDEASSILSAFEKDEVQAYSGGAHDLVSLLGRGFEATSLMPAEFRAMPSTAVITSGKIMDENPERSRKILEELRKLRITPYKTQKKHMKQ